MRWVVLFLLAALSGCVSPVEVSEALEAPLPPQDVPFVLHASACGTGVGTVVDLIAIYPDGTLHHLVLGHPAAGGSPNANHRAPLTEAERVALDADRTGTLVLADLQDAQGRFHIAHAERLALEESQLRNLQRRVTLAGFPALEAAYGESQPDCVERYAAWSDGKHWTIEDQGADAPWVLRHVRDLLRELH